MKMGTMGDTYYAMQMYYVLSTNHSMLFLRFSYHSMA